MDSRLIDFEAVRELVGKSRTTLWRWEQEGKFPQRVQVGPNSVGWLRNEVVDWIEAKAAQRRARYGDTTAPTSRAVSEPRTTARIQEARQRQASLSLSLIRAFRTGGGQSRV